MSKIMDTDLLWFNVRMHGLQVTDLMQGPVYGIHTSEFAKDNHLETSFAYDDIFGTVLNRFIVQAIANIPLTVYGSGSQIRGYINLKDTLQCINLAIQNPPGKDKLSIYNQFTEQFSVNELSKIVKNALKYINIDVKINHLDNPRVESEKHYYNADNKGMKKLGLKPTLLTKDTIIEIAEYVIKYKKRINKKIIQPKINWK
jgi:UDP-sulfoquinovose synthase